MPPSNRYEIEIRGRATGRVLRPVVDDFEIEPTGHGTTRLVGDIRDPSHLHGLLAHFTSMNVEVVSLRCEVDSGDGHRASTNPDRTDRGTTP